MERKHAASYVGILLAAGQGMRFDPGGARSKLMQLLPDGDVVAVAAAKNLLAATPDVLAVVRPDAAALTAALRAQGCQVSICAEAEQGMGASLVHGLSARADADGWVIALADMPRVRPATVKALVDTIRAGADIAVPVQDGRRGNPVAFGRKHLSRLLQLRGDQGARNLLKEFPAIEVAVQDAGIFFDIDTPDDLGALL